MRKQLKGAHYPAPRAIMAAAVEGAQVDFDNAIKIETRYFVELATGKEMWSRAGFGPGGVLLAGDRLIVLGDQGQLVLVEASSSALIHARSSEYG